MTFRIRAAVIEDLPQLYEMAKLAGTGFTNLPPDRAALRTRLERSARAFASEESTPDELFVLILENALTGEVRGTAQIFARVGESGPFYSYRLATLTQHSRELGRTFRAEILNLVTDLEGSSEVGGLFLHPSERAGGLGLLLARSRYLFIAMHRARFGERILAELRGIIDERGSSPFWDGIAGRFFGMSFQEADYFNAINGNQFIADLMPRHPIYTAMLPESARSAIGLPHPTGRAAMRMLEAEGFVWEGYIDIFDGGPTMTARTSAVRSIAQAARVPLIDVSEPAMTGSDKALVAAGHLGSFRCICADVGQTGDGIVIAPAQAATLAAHPGDTVWMVPR